MLRITNPQFGIQCGGGGIRLSCSDAHKDGLRERCSYMPGGTLICVGFTQK